MLSPSPIGSPLIRKSFAFGSNTAPSWTVDATSGKGTPLSETEVEAVLSAAGVVSPNVTTLWRFGIPASGTIPDSIGTKTLTNDGAWTYQASESGWSLPFISNAVDGATSGAARLFNTTFPNVNANSATLFTLLKTAGSVDGDPRTLVSLGGAFDDDAVIEINSTPRLLIGEGDGTRTTGGNNPTGTVRWMVIRVDDSANTVDAFTEQEKIIAGTQACNGQIVQFGGNFSNSWWPAVSKYGLAFYTPVALTNTEIKNTLLALGESPGWSP